MHLYKETTIHKLYTGCEARLNFAHCTFKKHMVQKWAHTHCLAAKLGSYSMNIQTLMVMCVWHSFMKCHYLLLGLCGVCDVMCCGLCVVWCAVGCVWCAMGCVWCAVCGVLWVVCGVLWPVCGVLWTLCGMLCCGLCAVCGVLCLFPFIPFFIFGSWDHKFTPNINTFWHHLMHTCSITTACMSFFSKTEASAHTAKSSEHF